LAGCAVVVQAPPATAPPPSPDICTIAPNSALCQVLSPPTASEPVKPVQQAANEIIKTVVTSLPTESSAVFPDPAAGGKSSGTSSDKSSDKSADKSDPKELASTVAKNEPAKKMYCN
jgi:hypothetical protein